MDPTFWWHFHDEPPLKPSCARRPDECRVRRRRPHARWGRLFGGIPMTVRTPSQATSYPQAEPVPHSSAPPSCAMGSTFWWYSHDKPPLKLRRARRPNECRVRRRRLHARWTRHPGGISMTSPLSSQVVPAGRTNAAFVGAALMRNGVDILVVFPEGSRIPSQAVLCPKAERVPHSSAPPHL
ncbi:hypothetical protein B0H16DRAFT_512696 [Mycena metata]|uniref:Uncharacterized protein n=1 Tax=Mycena metata TaxID=1033252 RepID=A0AAD7MF92_9AGAR|nr:hypothetical protein B0H16DRAFT_512696 [Mycena metata]